MGHEILCLFSASVLNHLIRNCKFISIKIYKHTLEYKNHEMNDDN